MVFRTSQRTLTTLREEKHLLAYAFQPSTFRSHCVASSIRCRSNTTATARRVHRHTSHELNSTTLSYHPSSIRAPSQVRRHGTTPWHRMNRGSLRFPRRTYTTDAPSLNDRKRGHRSAHPLRLQEIASGQNTSYHPHNQIPRPE